MYICLCNAVSERRIQASVSEGACTMRDLTRELKVGTCCGKCIPAAREALAQALMGKSSNLGHPVANSAEPVVRAHEAVLGN